MTPYLRQLPQFYGEPPIRDLGLLASEGRMTIPFMNHSPAGVLDIWSHHFEFVPEAEAESTSPTVLGVHELKDGESYFIVPTTASGLYRYQISDLVRVRGFLGKTPMVEFLGKGNRFANLTGEKLSEHHVTQAMVRATERTGHSIQAYAVAPIWNDERPYYGLFIEGECSSEFMNEMERALSELNIEYAAKRGDRLGPVRAAVLPPGRGPSGTAAGWPTGRVAGAVQAPVPDRRFGVPRWRDRASGSRAVQRRLCQAGLSRLP